MADVKVAILAGGRGSRLAEETAHKPKPMVEICGKPLLWHIMKHYAHYGFTDFVIALGYKGDCIRRHFAAAALGAEGEDWTVDLAETGTNTMTGGRIKRLAPYLAEQTFMLTWGDGVSTVNLRELLSFHRAHGKVVTLTAVQPILPFGRLELSENQVVRFSEKPLLSEMWINGAFFVVEPEVFDYIDGDDTQWEQAPLEALAADGQLMAYRHRGFWKGMDTPADKAELERLWSGGHPPWKVWTQSVLSDTRDIVQTAGALKAD